MSYHKDVTRCHKKNNHQGKYGETQHVALDKQNKTTFKFPIKLNILKEKLASKLIITMSFSLLKRIQICFYSLFFFFFN